MLRVEMREIGDQILDHGHVWQRIDLHRAFHLVHAIGTGQRVDPVDVHRAGSADAFAAGPAEGQGRVDLVLDLDQRVQDHRAAGVHIDEIRVDGRVLAVVRIPAIDLKLPQVLGTFGFGPCFTGRHPGVLGERELNHIASPGLSGSCPVRYNSGAYVFRM